MIKAYIKKKDMSQINNFIPQGNRKKKKKKERKKKPKPKVSRRKEIIKIRAGISEIEVQRP